MHYKFAGRLIDHYDKYPKDILPWEIFRSWASNIDFKFLILVVLENLMSHMVFVITKCHLVGNWSTMVDTL
jgi:hypothetical protein